MKCTSKHHKCYNRHLTSSVLPSSCLAMPSCRCGRSKSRSKAVPAPFLLLHFYASCGLELRRRPYTSAVGASAATPGRNSVLHFLSQARTWKPKVLWHRGVAVDALPADLPLALDRGKASRWRRVAHLHVVIRLTLPLEPGHRKLEILKGARSQAEHELRTLF